MNIPGLEYNTEFAPIRVAQYGRIVQEMVDYAVTLPTKEERQAAANTIVKVMRGMTPIENRTHNIEDKLWNHLAMISNFSLDIDYPCDIEEAKNMQKRPEKLEYPQKNIKVRHYGNLLCKSLEILQEMPEGEERDALAELIANQMKRMQRDWSYTEVKDASILKDIKQFTNGKIEMPSSFHFDNTPSNLNIVADDMGKKKKKKKKNK